MDRELFASLAARAQAGDREAMEQLLLLSHTPVAYLCGKLLQNGKAARTLTREILTLIYTQTEVLGDSEDFELRLRRITAARCMQALTASSHPQDPPETVQIPRQALDEAQTSLVIQQMTDHLPEQPRLCLLLYCCGGIEIRGIARLTGTAEAAVLENLNRAQDNINKQLRKFHKMGIRFAKITSLPELLCIAMYQTANAEAAAAMVDGILEKKPLQSPAKPVQSRKDPIRALLIGVAGAALLLTGMLILVLLQGVS